MGESQGTLRRRSDNFLSQEVIVATAERSASVKLDAGVGSFRRGEGH